MRTLQLIFFICLIFLLQGCAEPETAAEGFEKLASGEITGDNPEEAEEYYKKGLQFYEKENYRKADIYFNKALLLSPGTSLIYIDMACALLRQDNSELAIKYLEKGAGLAPLVMKEKIEARNELDILKENENFKKLLHTIDGKIALEEQKTLFSGDFYSGDRKQAGELHTSALADYKKKDYKAAYLKWYEAARADPMWGRNYYNLACMSSLLGYSDAALGYVDMALKIDPFNLYRKIKKDSDLDSIRELPEFTNKLNGLTGQISSRLKGTVWVYQDVEFHFADQTLAVTLDLDKMFPGMHVDHDYSGSDLDPEMAQHMGNSNPPVDNTDRIDYTWSLKEGRDGQFYLNLYIKSKKISVSDALPYYIEPKNYRFKLADTDFGSILLEEPETNKKFRLSADNAYLKRLYGPNFIDLLTYEAVAHDYGKIYRQVTPFSRGLLENDRTAVEELLQKGKRPDSPIVTPYDPAAWSNPLLAALPMKKDEINYDFIEILLQNNADVNLEGSGATNYYEGISYERQMKSTTPLHMAVKLLDKKLVDLFINAGADVNAKDSDNRTPLYYFFEQDYYYSAGEIPAVLIEKGALTDFTCSDGQSFDEKYKQMNAAGPGGY